MRAPLFSSTRAGGAAALVALVLATFIASCTPFGASDGDDGGATSDAAASNATDASDQNAPNDGGATLDAADGSNPDGGPIPVGGAFCAGHPGAIQCFDFDNAWTPLGGLTRTEAGGTITVEPTFAGSSAPSALVARTLKANGRAIVTLPTIDFSNYTNKTITIDFRIYISAAATAAEYLGRLNFTSQSSPIALDSAGRLQCSSGIASSVLSAGGHTISISMAVDGSGHVPNFTCSLDGTAFAASTVTTSTGVSVELGNATSGSGKFVASYDDVLVRAAIAK